MNPTRRLVVGAALALAGCASLPRLDPPRVTLADIDSVTFEGMELRMRVKLRVQNPNGLALDYDGIDVRVSLQGQGVARGVSDERGRVPAYGEAIVSLPVTISLMELGRQAFGILKGGEGRMRYAIDGKLGGTLLGATQFHSEGELAFPAPDSGSDGTAGRERDGNPL